MKISRVHLVNLRNDEHFQYHTEFKDLITKHNADALKISAQFAPYLTLYEKEDEGIKKIRKSALTAEIHDADKARDAIWHGMIKTNTVALKHFDPEVQEAAKRLKVLFDTYGKVALKPLNEQTSALYNILQDLHGKYAADMAAAGLKPWVEELAARNAAFDKLMKERYDEAALKTDIVVKEARAALDESYHSLLERLAALMVLEGPAEYEQFIRALNIITEKYAATLARRHGKKKSAIDNGQLTVDN
jgi:hypothetical protein